MIPKKLCRQAGGRESPDGGAAVLGYWWPGLTAGHLLEAAAGPVVYPESAFTQPSKFKNGVGNLQAKRLVIETLDAIEAEVQADRAEAAAKVDGCKARYGCLAIHKALLRNRR